MKTYTIKELEEENKKILDKIDFVPYLKRSNDYSKIWSWISEDYDNTELTDNDICQGYIFNQLCDDDVADYIFNRYSGKIVKHEEVKRYLDYKD